MAKKATKQQNPDNREVSIKLDNSTLTHSAVTGGNVIGSFNESGPQTDLDRKLSELDALVQRLSGSLPNEKKADLNKAYSRFKEDTTAENPDKKWYQVSAQGLIGAATAVAGLAEPITKTVEDIITLISH